MNIPAPFKPYLNPRFVEKHPEKVKRLAEIYEHYHPLKQQFEDRLKGVYSRECSLMKDISPEDSKEVLTLLRNLKYNPFSFTRRGRGPKEPGGWAENGRHHLTVEQSTRFSIYVYGHVGAREAGITLPGRDFVGLSR